MANENEDIKKDSQEKNEAENGEKPKHHHTSILGHIIEKIEDEIENMNGDFPLSGGVDHPIHDLHTHHLEEEAKSEPEDAPKEEHHKKTSFFDDLNTEFPLSGGEVER